MRISDWSSDVCSSDLAREPAPETAARAVAADDLDPDRHLARRGLVGGGVEPAVVAGAEYQRDQLHHQLDGGQAAAVEVAANAECGAHQSPDHGDRKSTRLNSSH